LSRYQEIIDITFNHAHHWWFFTSWLSRHNCVILRIRAIRLFTSQTSYAASDETPLKAVWLIIMDAYASRCYASRLMQSLVYLLMQSPCIITAIRREPLTINSNFLYRCIWGVAMGQWYANISKLTIKQMSLRYRSPLWRHLKIHMNLYSLKLPWIWSTLAGSMFNTSAAIQYYLTRADWRLTINYMAQYQWRKSDSFMGFEHLEERINLSDHRLTSVAALELPSMS
jgi:hypothetical protein